ncbi:hypothetical protein [Crocosphaera chwakensis]|uniref:Integral membrane protein n=1 Tax=Crocosphaera chwakensis CCY0110 TaxID=391612 RepID=A3IH29_9CHRO|nr:hypothetical protein [Crocosphaera chwakensis]EAZ94271.1 hypothetical protein CY0110_10362 [Crocosphaera chwakensis CCY0110]
MAKQSLVTKEKKKPTSGIRLTGDQKSWLISLHVISGAIWFGTVLSMVVMVVHNLNTTNGDELYAINSVVKLLDDWVVIPAANITLLTGLLICWFTIWGFFKFYWVITKLVMTVTLITFGTFWLGPWTNAMTAISDSERLQALNNPLFMFDTKALIIGGLIQITTLIFIFIISFLKPWGRRDIKAKNKPKTSAT